MNCIIEKIEEYPIIAAIRNTADIHTAIASQVTTIFYYMQIYLILCI
ncbi:MAG: hypothetical protein PWP27_2321 [Clostridiales bacterium]|nr:hypothetical protein [Clostridiales bacterium]MDK2934511.1 hypothetical protein [Clostridiales bacterium]